MVSPFYKTLPYEEYLRGVLIRDTFISYNKHLRQREENINAPGDGGRIWIYREQD